MSVQTFVAETKKERPYQEAMREEFQRVDLNHPNTKVDFSMPDREKRQAHDQKWESGVTHYRTGNFMWRAVWKASQQELAGQIGS